MFNRIVVVLNWKIQRVSTTDVCSHRQMWSTSPCFPVWKSTSIPPKIIIKVRVLEIKCAVDYRPHWTHPLILCILLKPEAPTPEDQSLQTPPGPPERGAGSSGQSAAFLRGDQESPGQAVCASPQCGLPKGQELPPRSVTSASWWAFGVSVWWKWTAGADGMWTFESERWHGQVLNLTPGWMKMHSAREERGKGAAGKTQGCCGENTVSIRNLLTARLGQSVFILMLIKHAPRQRWYQD